MSRGTLKDGGCVVVACVGGGVGVVKLIVIGC